MNFPVILARIAKVIPDTTTLLFFLILLFKINSINQIKLNKNIHDSIGHFICLCRNSDRETDAEVDTAQRSWTD